MCLFSKIREHSIDYKECSSKCCEEVVNSHRVNSKVEYNFHEKRDNRNLHEVFNLYMMMFGILNKYFKWFNKYKDNSNYWENFFCKNYTHLSRASKGFLRHFSKMRNMNHNSRNYFIAEKKSHIEYICCNYSHEDVDRPWNKESHQFSENIFFFRHNAM